MKIHVPHYLKEKLDKIKNAMDETKFLVSEGYRNFLQGTLRNITGKYDLKVVFAQSVATDGQTVWVNPVHPYVMTCKSLAEKTLNILGQLAHELFHVLYTDFQTLKALEREYKPQGKFRYKNAHECMNIIEDSAIELAGTNYYTGMFRTAILYSNENALKNMPSLNELAKRNVPRLSIFKQACAMYAIIGKMKGKLQDPDLIKLFAKAMPILDRGRLAPDSWGRLEAASQLYRLMLPLIEEVEKLKKEQQAEENYQYTKNEQISSGGPGGETEDQPDPNQDFQKGNRQRTKKQISKQNKQNGQSDDDQDSDDSQGKSGKKPKSKSKSKKDDKGDAQDADGDAKGKQGDEKKDSKKKGSGSGSDDDQQEVEDEGQEKNGSGSKGKQDDQQGEQKGDGSGDGSDDQSDDKNQGGSQNGSASDSSDDADGKPNGDSDASKQDDKGNQTDAEQSDQNFKQDSKLPSDTDANLDEDGEYSEELSEKDAEAEAAKNAQEVEQALKELCDQLDEAKTDEAKTEYDRQEQAEQDRKIREFAATVKYSEIHRFITVNAIREFPVTDAIKASWEESFEPIRSLTRNMTKNILEVIRMNEDWKMNGMYEGKINTSQLSRTDKRVFFQRKEKSQEADLAFLILVDQSGSMRSDRITYARLACMMMVEVCHALRIPIAVIGHAAVYGRNQVVHRHFVDFGSRDPNEKYKLAGMTTYDNTREGVSLKYAGEYLLRRPEQDKYLIAISDGEPYHPSANDTYGAEIAQKDTGRVAKELEAKGVNVFGCAIGDGKSAIQAIYTKNYIDIPEIGLLPNRLLGLLRRNLFK